MKMYSNDKMEILKNNRDYILRHLQELQADLEDFSDEELVEHRDCMLERVNSCLNAIGEDEEDNESYC